VLIIYGEVDMNPLDFVTGRIVARYGHPARAAYLYMFRLRPGADFSPILPPQEAALAAWVDEGDGLLPTPIEAAIERCRAALEIRPDVDKPQRLTAHQRRQMMARSVFFSLEQTAEGLIEVHLQSRSLAFSPKGDRIAHETWRPTRDGWYSAYRPHPED
jgi:hypothetical protein